MIKNLVSVEITGRNMVNDTINTDDNKSNKIRTCKRYRQAFPKHYN